MTGTKLYTGRVWMYSRSNGEAALKPTTAAAQADADARVALEEWDGPAAYTAQTWQQARNTSQTSPSFGGSYMRAVGSQYIAVRWQFKFVLKSALRCEVAYSFVSGASGILSLDQSTSELTLISDWTGSLTGNNTLTIAIRFPPYT